MARASGRAGQPVLRATVSWLSKMFALDPAGLNWPRGVIVLDIALAPLIVFWAIGYQQYLLSALFGLLFSALGDPGGRYGRRVSRLAVYGLTGAGLTALAFGIGAETWGWLVLAAFAVTLAAGLAAAFGVHRFVTALLLNIWFVVALSLAFNLHRHPRITDHTWAQVAAWAGGSVLWIAGTFADWLIHRREDRPQLVPEMPGDTARKKLTRPMAAFAVIRALVIAGTVALALGLDLPHGYWMPIAAMVALRPDLQQATMVASQRLAGALIGAIAAALLLLIPAGQSGRDLYTVNRGLEVVALVLFMHGAALRFWNYAFYCAAIAAGVLLLVDLPQPSHYNTEGYRVLWTLCGVTIALAVMLLTNLLAKRTAPPRPPA